MANSLKDYKETINDRLKEFRSYSRMTQKELAKSLGLATSYYSDIENQRRSVSKNTIEKLHSIYHVSINWMYTGDGSMFDNAKEGKNVPDNVPVNVPYVNLLEGHKDFTINTTSATLIDNWLNSSLQILNFYCSSLLGQISGDNPHNKYTKDLKDYAFKVMDFSSDIRLKLRDNTLGYKTLDFDDKILLITQLNQYIEECLDILWRTFSKMEFKWRH